MQDRAKLAVWCNAHLDPALTSRLEAGLQGHQLVLTGRPTGSHLDSGAPEESLRDADIAFGQPDPETLTQSRRIRWVQLNSAGYGRYDTGSFRDALRERGAVLTNSSSVYDEPCAEHVLAFMLAHARQLPPAFEAQRTSEWTPGIRRGTSLLRGHRAALLGLGAIGRRLLQLLAPFGMSVTAVRRTPSGDEGMTVLSLDRLSEAVEQADHVVNLLPDASATRGLVNGDIFAAMKTGAVFHNVGRGTTVDQEALIRALQSGRLRAAWLDVTDPEPLPADHPLWTAPNCHITPHCAGGFEGEHAALVEHFLENFARYLRGESLLDRRK